MDDGGAETKKSKSRRDNESPYIVHIPMLTRDIEPRPLSAIISAVVAHDRQCRPVGLTSAVKIAIPAIREL